MVGNRFQLVFEDRIFLDYPQISSFNDEIENRADFVTTLGINLTLSFSSLGRVILLRLTSKGAKGDV
jgi:hypothetical protein